jgi:hypothetical protein
MGTVFRYQNGLIRAVSGICIAFVTIFSGFFVRFQLESAIGESTADIFL